MRSRDASFWATRPIHDHRRLILHAEPLTELLASTCRRQGQDQETRLEHLPSDPRFAHDHTNAGRVPRRQTGGNPERGRTGSLRTGDLPANAWRVPLNRQRPLPGRGIKRWDNQRWNWRPGRRPQRGAYVKRPMSSDPITNSAGWPAIQLIV